MVQNVGKIEDKLFENCVLLTISHRNADWFNIKMLISGIMYRKLSNQKNDFDGPYTATTLLVYLHRCLKSWYIRFKSDEAI